MTEAVEPNRPMSAATRRQVLGGVAIAAVGLTTLRARSAQAATASAGPPAAPTSAAPLLRHDSGIDRDTIQRWARDTWASMVALTHPATGLPADNISVPLSSVAIYGAP
jgi:hypothetical protein